jgi:hypothetical protein
MLEHHPHRALTDLRRIPAMSCHRVHPLKEQGLQEIRGGSVLVQYETGGCHNLTVARATLSGRTIRLTILEGTDGSDQVCPMNAWSGFVLVRLPAPALPRVTFAHIRCGHEQQPACPRS